MLDAFLIIFLFCFFAVFLQSVASKLSQITPAFDSSRSANTSATCKIHSRQFLDALSRLELWAFQSNFAYLYHYLFFCSFLCNSFLIPDSLEGNRLSNRSQLFNDPKIKMNTINVSFNFFPSFSARCIGENSIWTFERQYQSIG